MDLKKKPAPFTRRPPNTRAREPPGTAKHIAGAHHSTPSHVRRPTGHSVLRARRRRRRAGFARFVVFHQRPGEPRSLLLLRMSQFSRNR